jgi:hypothetical protein
VVVVLLAAAWAALWAAAPASAHAAMGPDAQFYRSVVTSVSPPVPGLVVAVERTGQTVTVTNGTGKPVEVSGVTGEPFLRFGPGGVDENTSSLTSKLNAVRKLGSGPLPQQTGSIQPVTWKHVSDAASYSWSDHRTHWMSLQRPPQVAADPRAPHPVSTWTMTLTVDGEPVTVSGTLSWAGASRLAGWRAPATVGGLVVVALVAVGLAVRRSVRPADRKAA